MYAAGESARNQKKASPKPGVTKFIFLSSCLWAYVVDLIAHFLGMRDTMPLHCSLLWEWLHTFWHGNNFRYSACLICLMHFVEKAQRYNKDFGKQCCHWEWPRTLFVTSFMILTVIPCCFLFFGLAWTWSRLSIFPYFVYETLRVVPSSEERFPL